MTPFLLLSAGLVKSYRMVTVSMCVYGEGVDVCVCERGCACVCVRDMCSVLFLQGLQLKEEANHTNNLVSFSIELYYNASFVPKIGVCVCVRARMLLPGSIRSKFFFLMVPLTSLVLTAMHSFFSSPLLVTLTSSPFLADSSDEF